MHLVPNVCSFLAPYSTPVHLRTLEVEAMAEMLQTVVREQRLTVAVNFGECYHEVICLEWTTLIV